MISLVTALFSIEFTRSAYDLRALWLVVSALYP